MIETSVLREKILDLAIRGKLVPQDPNDEPASVLLDRIREKKEQMVKEGKLKAKDLKNDTVIFVGDDNLHYEKFSDGMVKCIEDEIPFELPHGWVWCRYADAIELYSGQDLSPERYNDTGVGIPYITGASNMENGKVVVNRWTTTPTTHATKGDLLLTVKGSGVGKMAYCDIEDAHIARQIMALRCREFVIYEYLEIAVSASVGNLTSQANGLIPGIARDTVLSALMPLPPLPEQMRIYNSAANLLKEVSRIALQSDELKCLVNSAKSKILDLAIRGKLVPQDPADEPASLLLECIRAEKEELIRQRKIKRDKKDSIIFKGEDNSYYPILPSGWTTCSLLDLAEIDLGKTLDKAKNTGRLYPYLRSVNVQWNKVDLMDLNEMRFEPDEIERYTVRKRDLLICEGGDVGRCCVWEEDPFLYQNALHRVRFYSECNPYFFMYVLMFLEDCGHLKRISTGVTIKHLTKNILCSIQFPLPPLNEQDRIVEAINVAFAQLNNIAVLI